MYATCGTCHIWFIIVLDSFVVVILELSIVLHLQYSLIHDYETLSINLKISLVMANLDMVIEI